MPETPSPAPRRPARSGTRFPWQPIPIVAVLVGIVLARVFVIEAFRVPAGSMTPTLPVGTHFFLNKLYRTPQRGDVVVFRYPPEPSKDFVKRVVAVAGDTIDMQDGALRINGAAVPRVRREGPCSYQDRNDMNDTWEAHACEAYEETLDGKRYTVYQDPQVAAQRSWKHLPMEVPAGHFYVLGDNRDMSHDSRYWGAVPAPNLKGKVAWIWWRGR